MLILEPDGNQISSSKKRIAVVIPCYRVTSHILDVITSIGKEVCRIYVVDDKCPDASGKYVENHCLDQRVQIIYHECNQGVGGAVMSGYRAAIADGAEVIVKLDGDGQMDTSLIHNFIRKVTVFLISKKFGLCRTFGYLVMRCYH